jgi:hypothetical protein
MQRFFSCVKTGKLYEKAANTLPNTHDSNGVVIQIGQGIAKTASSRRSIHVITKRKLPDFLWKEYIADLRLKLLLQYNLYKFDFQLGEML